MSRGEFIERLRQLLQDVPPTEREEAIQYYTDYFDDAGEENEAGVIASLGSPEELAKVIKAGLNDGGAAGEFTESGFAGYGTRVKAEVAAPGSMAQPESEEKKTEGTDDAHTSHNGQESTASKPEKRKLSGGIIALIVIAVILTFPLWIGIVAGLFGIAVGLLGGLFGILVGVLACGIALIVAGAVVFSVGIATLGTLPLGGLCLIGVSFLIIAVGILFFWLMVLGFGKVLPWAVRGIAALFQKLFHRGGATV